MDKKIVLLIILLLVGGRTFSQVHYSIEGSTDHEYEGRKLWWKRIIGRLIVRMS